ncbi:Fe(3+)-hydroxamate ABC transporter permease FhuB [Roseibium algae]|uniref:Fe(3+)-hydroxamate ABC transporter permease FhuB n=1 Tax=Roseibium algae TaxID=3123038 RepID=A0ABU8TL15_9HYPH
MKNPEFSILKVWPLAALGGVLLYLVFGNVSTILGAPISLATIFEAAMVGPMGDSAPALQFSYVYLPQLVISLLCGAGLGFAGAVFQQTLLNPLASPATLGVSSGAQLALTVALLLAPEFHANHAFAIALTGSCLAWGVVALLAGRRLEDPLTLVLTGMIVSFTLAAITTCLFVLKDSYLNSMFIWGAGDLTQNGWNGTAFLLPKLALGAIVVLTLSRQLSLLGLGSDVARSAGVSAGLSRTILLSAAILMSAAITATVGIIAFVGLAAPHIARMMGARCVVPQLLCAAVMGALLLGVADQGLQFALQDLASFLPAGALAGLLGAPLLLYLMMKMSTRRPELDDTPMLRAPVNHGTAIQVRIIAGLGVLLVLCLVIALSVPWSGLDAISVWRLPRVAAALLAGCALGCAGCLAQRLIGNPMASPESMGISAGAITGTIAVMLLLPMAEAAGQTIGALLGSLLVFAAVLYFGRRQSFDPRSLILVGIAITALADALILVFFATGDPRLGEVLALSSGSTYRITFDTLFLPAGISVLGLVLALPTLRWLEILPLGAVTGRSLGLPLASARFLIILATSLLTVAATLLIGPISFVGLAAPHIARALGLRSAVTQFAGSALAGGAVIVFADFIGRQMARPYELPAGLLSILVGAIVFVAVLSFSRLFCPGMIKRQDTSVRQGAAVD